jgi:hypothetical protein
VVTDGNGTQTLENCLSIGHCSKQDCPGTVETVQKETQVSKSSTTDVECKIETQKDLCAMGRKRVKMNLSRQSVPTK